MDLTWGNIFSIPDDTLVKEGSVDPMGMQIIWTYFGQEIFQNKLTTVATDIRNYTINLLHHFIIYKLEKENNGHFEKALSKFDAYSNSFELKSGLLIYLEDLLVYALMDQKEEVDTLGLLGSSKADDNLQRFKNNKEQIKLEAEKTKGVLVRQIQLGVNGRYKGPFMNMNIISPNFVYTSFEFERIEKVMKEWPEGLNLAKVLLKILKELIDDSNGTYPIQPLSKYYQSIELWPLYKTCFKTIEVHRALKPYWESKLGITTGSAQSVFNQITPNTVQSTPEVFVRAFKDEKDEQEKDKIQKILEVEPFLSVCSHVFYLLSDRSVKRLGDVMNDLKDLTIYFSTIDISRLVGDNKRLHLLNECVKDYSGSPVKLAEGVLTYHKRIMENRGGGAWVELHDGNLKHYIRQSSSIKTADVIANTKWYHNYYLGALRTIYSGLNPKT